MIHLHASRDENKNAFFSLLQHFLLLIELEEGQWDSLRPQKSDDADDTVKRNIEDFVTPTPKIDVTEQFLV